MKTGFSVVMSVILSLLGSVSLAQPSPPVNEALADNAALVYWQAYSLMPELDEAEKKSLDNLLAGKTPDAQVAKTLRQAKESLRLLQRATKFSQCEWGLEYNRGVEMGLTHVSQARNLSKLAWARARIRFAEGQNQAAIDDILAALFLARRIGQDPVIVSLIVEYALEEHATALLLRYLPQLEKSELDSLTAGIDCLPQGKTMADGWRMEKELVLEWFIRELRKPDSKDRVLTMFGNKDDPNIVALTKMSQSEMLGAAIQLRGVYDEVSDVLTSSPDEVDAFIKEMMAKVDSMGPAKHFAAYLIPSVRDHRRRCAVHQVRCLMLSAAIAVAKDGQSVLKRDDLRDPFGQGPLEYKTLSKGFQLSSKLIGLDGEPITLTVGGE
jgi:hypothetical protein